ncbi:MAG: hypothetical protein EOL91_05125 [Actinobacteria bacterium]|nr:hypothetical protein [Actinomycetota bacterium]
MGTYLRSPNALSAAEIAEVYSTAEQHNVAICLYSGTQSPSDGPAEWLVSGSISAVRRFTTAVAFNTIPKPSYREVRWTDKHRWE